MAGIGCLLMVVALVTLGVLVVLPVLPFMEDNATIDRLMQPLMCRPGETLRREQYSTTDADGTSYSMHVYCEDEAGNSRRETNRWIVLGIASFTLPFTVGLFALIFGVSRAARRMAVTPANLSQIMTAAGLPAQPGTPNLSLVDRLQQIEEAHTAGLISTAEYERLRQQTLNDMT